MLARHPAFAAHTPTHTASDITPAFVNGLRRGLARVERLGRTPLTLLLLQNAPRHADPDAEALTPGTASRRAAVRHWRLGHEAALDGTLRVNLLRDEPFRYVDPVRAALGRLRVAIEVCGTRVGAIVAAGELGRDAAARLLGVPGRLQWNAPQQVTDRTTLLAVPHPSGRCRLYNPGRVGTDAWRHVRPLVLGGM